MKYVETKKITEADAAVCQSCDHVLTGGLWPLRNSIGLHAGNGMCGGRKKIKLYRIEVSA